jgi:ferredoxin-NADP reductase
VVAEGALGVFTSEAKRCEKTLLTAGGIGITPIRALLDELDGDVVVLYRVLKSDDAIFGDELEQTSARVEVVAGHHDFEGKSLLSPEEGVFHTISLNRNLIPVLAQQVLAGQLTTKIDVVSEATDSSLAFDRSLQAALVKARKV